MGSKALRDAIKKATGKSDRTVRGWLLAIEREHLVTREQAELVLAYKKGVDIRKHVSKEALAEIRSIVREQPAAVSLPTAPKVRETTTASIPAKATPSSTELVAPIVRMDDSDVTAFLRENFSGYTRRTLGRRLKNLCDTREGLRQILMRDVSDAARCYAHGIWKSCVVICGGTIEGMLTALLEVQQVKQVDAAYGRVRKGHPRKSLKKYTLEDKLDVATELGILAQGSASFGHGVRNYRNYVHPEKELSIGYPLGQRDARLALETVLKILDEIGK